MPRSMRRGKLRATAETAAGWSAKELRAWLDLILAARRDRNNRLIAKLQSLGVDITLAEVETVGRTLTGRPHFARVLVDKGYAKDIQAAFDIYLDESARGSRRREHLPT